jgi:2-polyprenyl-3-methyl-5-hydroxy-6-metoxy-1,4-benzoquinol methylase
VARAWDVLVAVLSTRYGLLDCMAGQVASTKGWQMDRDATTARRDDVRSQWRVVERLEGLPEADAHKLHASAYAGQYNDAIAHLPELKRWSRLPDRSRRVYKSKSDQSRIWRVCQFLSSDDRVLDIGMGHGWTAGILAQAVQPAAYAGIDLTDGKFDSVREMAEVNGLDASSWYLGVKDLYDLTPEWVAQRDPTILLLLEVLEHVPDPQRALATIADSIGPDTELLFSVPMLGRIESCWGHVSIFDAHRVRQLCENAGLHVHWVEPLYNTWQLLLVSRSSTPPARLAWVPSGPLADVAALASDEDGGGEIPVGASDGDPAFRRASLKPSALAPSAWTTPRSQSQVSPHESGGVRLNAQGQRGLLGNDQYAGIAVPVDGLRVLRLEISIPESAGVSRLLIEGRDDDGRRTVLWELRRGLRRRMPKAMTTHVLRPGQGSGGFRPVDQADPGATRVIEVVARLRPRARAALVLRRMAVVR